MIPTSFMSSSDCVTAFSSPSTSSGTSDIFLYASATSGGPSCSASKIFTIAARSPGTFSGLRPENCFFAASIAFCSATIHGIGIGGRSAWSCASKRATRTLFRLSATSKRTGATFALYASENFSESGTCAASGAGYR